MRFLFLVLSVSSLLGASACGGKVVVDGNGGVTGGAGGTTSSSPTSGGGSTSSSPSSGSGDEDALCFQLCQAELLEGCAGNDCLVRCASTLGAGPGCLDAAKAAASCIEDHVAGTPTCAVLICADEITSYLTCASAPTCTKALVGGNNVNPDCIGKGVCGAGGDEWSASCEGNGLCQCSINANIVGSCQETGPFLCDFLHGCCGAFFPAGK